MIIRPALPNSYFCQSEQFNASAHQMKSLYIFREAKADLIKKYKKASLSSALFPKAPCRKQHCPQELFCVHSTRMPQHPTLPQRNLAPLKAVSPSVFNIPPKYMFSLKWQCCSHYQCCSSPPHKQESQLQNSCFKTHRFVKRAFVATISTLAKGKIQEREPIEVKRKLF